MGAPSKPPVPAYWDDEFCCEWEALMRNSELDHYEFEGLAHGERKLELPAEVVAAGEAVQEEWVTNIFGENTIIGCHQEVARPDYAHLREWQEFWKIENGIVIVSGSGPLA